MEASFAVMRPTDRAETIWVFVVEDTGSCGRGSCRRWGVSLVEGGTVLLDGVGSGAGGAF